MSNELIRIIIIIMADNNRRLREKNKTGSREQRHFEQNEMRKYKFKVKFHLPPTP